MIIFYDIPATKQLNEAVATAQYPPLPTIVKKRVVASTSCRPSEGMETTYFRQLVLNWHPGIMLPFAPLHCRTV